MTSHAPIVSIGLPVYNGERWLDEAIQSILDQTFRDLELIICDNASTDKTQDICERWVQRDARVRYYRNASNIGLMPNHNLAFSNARGEFFQWFAYDDRLHPESIEKRITVLRQRPEIVLVYSATEGIDSSGNLTHAPQSSLDLDHDRIGDRFSRLMQNIPASEAVIYGLMRRDTLAQTLLLRNCLGADRCLLAELALSGRMYKIPAVLFYRRLHDGNVVTSQEEPWRFHPDLSGKLIFPHWRVKREHVRTIFRSSLSLSTKLRLLLKLGGWMMHQKSILKSELGFAFYFLRQRLLGKNPTLAPVDRKVKQS
jgi:glycosyltransferase involved in cell wall biosynthesis